MLKRYSHLFIIALIFGINIQKGACQISIVNRQINSYSVTPQSIMNIEIVNAGQPANVIVEGKLYNSTGEILLSITTQPFALPHGNYNGINFQIESTQYNNSNQAEYIRVNHILPSGKYNLCYQIVSASEAGIFLDDCDELVSDFNSNLYLVSPYDEEVIETKYPVLIWYHSEPFELLSSGEFFRLILTEKEPEQSAGTALSENLPVYIKDYLISHQVPYPIDAVPLQEGKQYAWEVEKISQGSIIQKTDPWFFSLKKRTQEPDNKYVVLVKSLDASVYSARNGKIFFRFDQEYNPGKIKCRIVDSHNNTINGFATNEKFSNEPANYVTHGYNRFELDLNSYHLKDGIYLLQVENESKEIFQLKFNITND